MNTSQPTLLVNEAICRQNIQKMKGNAERSNASLRPHFKTHQSATIANWFKEEGIDQCTVSSVSMASYFAKHGWNDITIAFPYNPLEVSSLNELASSIRINILIESEHSLHHALQHLQHPVGHFIKIDVGTHRTGIDHRNTALISNLIALSSDVIQFQGFIAHAGHTYGAKGKDNIQWIVDGAQKMLEPLREAFGGVLSYGDTPSCSTMEDLSIYDELRPGNFVFYDWMQHNIGSCSIENIAVCMACPVVAVHPERNEVVVYGGAVHFSKDFIHDEKGKTFGKVVHLDGLDWDHEIIGNVDRISQEHGIIKTKPKTLEALKPGDLIGVIPVHSCLSADLQGHYLSTKNERIDKHTKA